MILRSILLAGILLPLSLIAVDSDSFSDDAAISFERGLSVGIDSIDREYRVQGWKEEQVEPLDYMVVLNTKSCTTKKILLLKEFGFRRGLTPIELTNDLLYFKSFGSKPDADDLVSSINAGELKDNFEKAYVYRKRPGEKFNKAPFVFKYIFDAMQREIKNGVQILVLSPEQAKAAGIQPLTKEKPKPVPVPEVIAPIVTPKEVVSVPAVPVQSQPVEVSQIVAPEPPVTKVIPASKPIPAKPAAKQPVKQTVKKTVLKASAVSANTFMLKGKVVEYYSYLTSDGGSDLNLKGRKYEDRKFEVQRTLENKEQQFLSSGTVMTVNGVKYVKVKGKNMYFDTYSTTLGE